jgi:hypothetical protein
MNDLTKFLVEGILQEAENGVVVLLPGGFKPPHGGHLDLAKRYASQPNVSEVQILIGPKERDGITREQSMAVWKALLIGTTNITIHKIDEDNPLLASYKYIETAKPGTYALAASSKGEDYERVKKFVAGHAKSGKYNRKGVSVVELPLSTKPLIYKGRKDGLNGKGISASTLRADLAAKKYDNFKTNYPGTSEDTLKSVYSILTKKSMRESVLLNEGGVICEVCGSVLKQITPNHLKHKHQMTLLEYINKYPKALTHSENLRYTLKVNNPMKDAKNIAKIKKTKEERFGSMKEAANVDKAKQTKLSRYGDENYNNPRFGEANSSKRPEVRKRISQGVKESYTLELRELRKQLFTETRNSAEFKERMYELGLMYRPGERLDKTYYTDKVRQQTQENYTEHFYKIKNAKLRGHNYHLDHKLSIHEGYKLGVSVYIISHPANLEILPKTINERKGSKSSLTLPQLLRDIMIYEDEMAQWFGRDLLLCGGAAGHLAHPYEDYDLTFGDIQNMINAALSGKIEYAQEKLDGQNLMVTYKDGQVRAARNKGQVKNFAANSLTVKQVEDMFSGRGPIQAAFAEAMKDLETAINKLTPAQKQRFFGNGSKFINLEVLYPATANVVPYGATQLRLHHIKEYDEAGNVVGEDIEAAKQLQGAMRQVQAENQKTYEIRTTDPLTINKSADYEKQKGELTKMLATIIAKYKLKKDNKMGMYLQAWWKEYIKNMANQYGYKIGDNTVQQLIQRWAFSNKEVSIKTIRDNITNDEFKNWVINFDKKDYADQKKNAAKPIENLFLKLGVYTLRNIENLVALSPDESVRQIKSDLKTAIQQIKAAAASPDTADDDAALKFLKRELGRLNDIGGFKAIVPTEGLVFKYNDKLYKLTGAFAPINQILGYLKF